MFKIESDAEPERPLEVVVGLCSSIYSASVIVKRLVASTIESAFSGNVTTLTIEREVVYFLTVRNTPQLM